MAPTVLRMVTKKPARRPGRPGREPLPRASDLVPGNDDQDVADGVTVTLDSAGIAALRPVAFDRMTPEARALASDMLRNTGQQRQLSAELEEMVAHARRHGMSWNSIGWCVGTSAQAAQKRFSE